MANNLDYLNMQNDFTIISFENLKISMIETFHSWKTRTNSKASQLNIGQLLANWIFVTARFGRRRRIFCNKRSQYFSPPSSYLLTYAHLVQLFSLSLTFSVTRLGDFWKFLVPIIFQKSPAQMFGDFFWIFWVFWKHHFLSKN